METSKNKFFDSRQKSLTSKSYDFDSHQNSLNFEVSEKINIWDILFWIIIIVLFIMILTRMFGSSATEVQIYLGIISGQIIVVGYILKLMSSINNQNIKILNIENNMKNSFRGVREDMSKIKKKLKIQ